MVKLCPNRHSAQLLVRNKYMYTVFTIGGTLALRFTIPAFYDRKATNFYLMSML